MYRAIKACTPFFLKIITLLFLTTEKVVHTMASIIAWKLTTSKKAAVNPFTLSINFKRLQKCNSLMLSQETMYYTEISFIQLWIIDQQSHEHCA